MLNRKLTGGETKKTQRNINETNMGQGRGVHGGQGQGLGHLQVRGRGRYGHG